MDAKQTFNLVAENYNEAKADPTNFRKLLNAVVTMNSVAEQLALHQDNYPPLLREQVDQRSADVRSQYPDLIKVLCRYAEARAAPRWTVGERIINWDFAGRPGDMGDH